MGSILMSAALMLPMASLAQAADRHVDESRDLRVMTFNIRFGTADDGEDRWENRREMLFDVIRRHRPDVLGVQEALRFQLDEIRAAVAGYGLVGAGRDDGRQKGEYSALLYREDRLRAVDSSTFWFSDTPATAGSMTWGNRLPRICTWARFEDRATRSGFYAYNLHLDHQSQPSRERSTQLLARRIAELTPAGTAVVVTGDFNADELNPAMKYLWAAPELRAQTSARSTRPAVPTSTRPAAETTVRLVDTFRVAHPHAREVGTFHGFKGSTRGGKIDYILVRPGTEVLEAEILRDHLNDRYPSDHFPLLAVVRLTPGR